MPWRRTGTIKYWTLYQNSMLRWGSMPQLHDLLLRELGCVGQQQLFTCGGGQLLELEQLHDLLLGELGCVGQQQLFTCGAGQLLELEQLHDLLLGELG
jgi:hypothetical protein